jgi:hypothetical protein
MSILSEKTANTGFRDSLKPDIRESASEDTLATLDAVIPASFSLSDADDKED